MHLLISLRSDEYYRFVESIVEEVVRRGGRVTLITKEVEKLKTKIEGLPRAGVAVEAALPNTRWSARWLRVTRELRSYLHWLALRAQPGFLIDRWLMYIPRAIGNFIRLVRWLNLDSLLTGRLRGMLAWFEEQTSPSRNIADHVQSLQPDLVLVTPLLYADAWEIDYLKACRQLGQSHAALIASWDNLTSKGIFHVRPDLVLVWNDVQVQEAVMYHSFPEASVVPVGAPVFDWLFAGDLLQSREEFCRGADLDPARPFVVYAVSSGIIHGDETDIVRKMRERLEELAPSLIQILVRPHPNNRAGWDAYGAPGIRVISPPRGVGRQAEKINLINTLYHSAAIVALNTSVFLEAAILDRPGLTLLFENAGGDPAAKKHTAFPHFEYLLRDAFLDTVEDEAACAERIVEIVRGNDCHKAGRSAFVQRFIRPAGLETPASHVAVNVLERALLSALSPTASANLSGAVVQSQPRLVVRS